MTKGDATKVKFVIQNKSDNYYLVATGSNGVYQITENQPQKKEQHSLAHPAEENS